MAKVRWQFDMEGFAAARNDPALVAAMETAANNAVTSTPFEVKVEVWPHQGRKRGPRTSVQIWAHSYEARRQVNKQPGELTAALGRVNL